MAVKQETFPGMAGAGPANSERGVTEAVDLPFHDQAVRQARHLVRGALARWRLPQLIDACQLAVSELVANAVTHGRPPVRVVLRRWDSRLRVDVQDATPVEALTLPPDLENPDAESGRGLAIVDAVSDEAGTEQIPGDGKRVFATWRTDPDPRPSSSI